MRRLRQPSVFLVAILFCLAVVGPALAGTAKGGGRFVGKTAQGYPVHLGADQRQISLIRIKVKLRCRNGGLLFDDLSDFESAALRRNGRFNDIQHGTTDEVHWRGGFNGAKVSGSIRVEDRLKDGVRCDSGNVRFSARQRG